MKFSRPPRRLERLFVEERPLFFVTCCVYRRRPTLATPGFHEAFVVFAQRAIAEFNIAIGRYVIMPDHLHFFVAGPNDFVLGRWVGVLKRTLAKALPATGSADPIWQRGFFDHVLRSDESYAQERNYVRDNPVRAGLVANAEDWPYAGEIVYIHRA